MNLHAMQFNKTRILGVADDNGCTADNCLKPRYGAGEHHECFRRAGTPRAKYCTCKTTGCTHKSSFWDTSKKTYYDWAAEEHTDPRKTFICLDCREDRHSS